MPPVEGTGRHHFVVADSLLSLLSKRAERAGPVNPVSPANSDNIRHSMA
jgi:hypothetical protein